ncbi:MAG: ThiF family adenylyltransferase [Bdellovibrionota bacterium]|nr:ThiF family adenylyltransferase [Pseudomonadota bacterium]MDY6091474.1 ThiF family adenylyltransferase [Bdellovibrionota bacterium]
MKKYVIKNDLVTLLFLQNNQILFKIEGNSYKKEVTNEEEILLYDIYKNNNLVEISSKNEMIIGKLIEIGLLCIVNERFIKYQKTSLEKTNHLLYMLFNDVVIEKILKKTIMIIGVGGIGIEIINHLIALGIKKFVLVDYDYIDITNLNRQLIFGVDDVGKNKLDVVKKIFCKKDKSLNFLLYKKKIECKNDLVSIIRKNSCDFIVCAADLPFAKINKSVIEASIELDIPCSFSGVGIKSGSVGPILNNNELKRQFLMKYDKLVNSGAEAFPVAGSISMTNSIVSAYLSMDIMFFLMGKLEKVKSLNKCYELSFFE